MRACAKRKPVWPSSWHVDVVVKLTSAFHSCPSTESPWAFVTVIGMLFPPLPGVPRPSVEPAPASSGTGGKIPDGGPVSCDW
eukprot:CAMPEP_0179000654 /NCGR_PEP_ID=MMETSP0795-20121207/10820_1 /TAXON_ID=88552 /ORGANISM="Amoebophrya sp., Strain Ameob2" /LENGTH=81 /DNA_ID=CAMNT_0020693731 /DNA_START=9 /DNA_END=251 /DNA_ORIENTATION=+